MIAQPELTAEEVRALALEVMQRHLKLEVSGYKCDRAMLHNVLLKAAADGQSIEAVCQDLSGLAASNTVRVELNKVLNVKDLKQHEQRMNEALTEWVPPALYLRRLELALDMHDEPFYGKSDAFEGYVCRGPAKAGTTHFIRVASVYVIWRDVRLTLAVTYVRPKEATLRIVKRLLKRVADIGLRWYSLYMDKGFCSTKLIRYLQARRTPAIIACAIRGKKGGIRALCVGRKSYTTDYTFGDGTTVCLVLCRRRLQDKNGQRRWKWLAYVLVELWWSPAEVFVLYRRRFGIECSYRSMQHTKAATTSRNPALRFFLLGLALLLENLWVRLRHTVAHVPGPGPRRVRMTHFPLRRFIAFLARAIEHIYPPILSCPLLCFSESVKY
jgi:DDE family transposase